MDWGTDGLHVWPLGDLREHEIDAGLSCWCQPREDEGLVIHSSADRRELSEPDYRCPPTSVA